MGKMWLIIIGVVVLLVVAGVAFAYLKPPGPNMDDPAKLEVVFSPEERQRLEAVSVSPRELAQATCEEGQRCWIAVDGVVYDMGAFPGWSRGRHHGVEAGGDATEAFVRSNHARQILEKMPVVGRLER